MYYNWISFHRYIFVRFFFFFSMKIYRVVIYLSRPIHTCCICRTRTMARMSYIYVRGHRCPGYEDLVTEEWTNGQVRWLSYTRPSWSSLQISLSSNGFLRFEKFAESLTRSFLLLSFSSFRKRLFEIAFQHLSNGIFSFSFFVEMYPPILFDRIRICT